MKKSPLISAAELNNNLTSENLVIIDARTGPDAREKYKAAHLAGAVFADMENDLSKKGPDASMGGRHPLPPVKDFAQWLGKMGIDSSKHIVIYDDKNGANAAARCWWMLKAVGHEDVQVLNGGLKAAIEAGLSLTAKAANIKPLPAYPADRWILPTVDMDVVAKAVTDPDYLVIDVREGFRYRGESEPIDTVAGHIPGAVNIPYIENLDETGQFLPTSELAAKYKEALGDKDPKQVIVHCGSGVTACHTLLAIEQAGMEIPNLYVGSWSEWSRNQRPIATGEK